MTPVIPSRSASRRSVSLAVFLIAVAAALAVGWYVLPRREAPANIAQRAAAPRSDGYKEVSAWMKENLDSPEWDKVRWWPSISLVEKRDDLMRPLEERRKTNSAEMTEVKEKFDDVQRRINTAGISDAEKLLDEMKSLQALYEEDRKIAEYLVKILNVYSSIPDSACRMKFRTKNRAGASELRDTFFEISKGRAKPLGDATAKALLSEFPE